MLSGRQSRFGDKPFKLRVVCPQNGTAVLKELRRLYSFTPSHRVRKSVLKKKKKNEERKKRNQNAESANEARVLILILRGPTILNRTYGVDKKLYISIFLPTLFGPIYYGLP